MKINHDLIGSTPWCDQYRDTLPEAMEKALAGDEDAQLIVVNCAAHFYGLSILDFGGHTRDIPALVDAVKGMDQELEFA